MRLVVTGSRGFLGGSIGRFAANSGHEVLGIGRSSQPGNDWPGKYVQADVARTDLSAVIRDFHPDVVLHAAGPASVRSSLATPVDDLQGAAMTWANALESIRRSGLKPLILFPSSAAVYGNALKLPISENLAVAPISPYGFHKVISEFLACEYSTCFDLNIIVCRLFSIFGAAQRRLLVWELYKQLAGPDSTAHLVGTGRETRDYLHIDDVCTAIFGLIESGLHKQEKGHYLAVNIGRGEETEVGELARRLTELIAPDKHIRCGGLERAGDPHRWCADISLLHSLIPSWRPKPFLLSLSECVAAWRGNGNLVSQNA